MDGIGVGAKERFVVTWIRYIFIKERFLILLLKHNEILLLKENESNVCLIKSIATYLLASKDLFEE